MKQALCASIVVIGLLAAPPAAEACSGCDIGCGHEFVPTSEPGAPSPTIPQNGGVVWHVTSEEDDAEITTPSDWIELSRIDGASSVPVDFTVTRLEFNAFVIQPVDPWEEGERYRVDIDISGSDTRCADNSPEATQDVVIGAPLEAPPGAFEISDCAERKLKVETRSGSCDVVLDAAACLVRWEEESGYRDVLFTETFVDGQPWKPRPSFCSFEDPPLGATWRGRLNDEVFADCSGDGWVPATPEFALSEGDHVVSMRTYLPGSEWDYTSEEVAVTLECEDGPSDAGGGSDAGTSDGGGQKRARDADAGPGIAGGGACTSAPGGRASSGLLGMVMLFGALVRRRRRT